MVLDCLTGVIKAIYTKTMSSEIGFKGLLKKITVLIIVALSNVLQQITGDNVAIREIVIMFSQQIRDCASAIIESLLSSIRSNEMLLRDVGSYIRGLTYSSNDVVEEDGILVIRSNNIVNGSSLD